MYQFLVIQYVFILWWRLYCTFIIDSFKVHEIFTVEKNSGFFWLQKVVVFGLSRYLVRDPFSFSFIRNKFHLHIFFFLRSKFTLKKTKLCLQIPTSVSWAILFFSNSWNKLWKFPQMFVHEFWKTVFGLRKTYFPKIRRQFQLSIQHNSSQFLVRFWFFWRFLVQFFKKNFSSKVFFLDF